MNRVLSYQTAVEANNGSGVNEYVTKRTCVSLILSIAFFTLIAGFLLGKFVANRQVHINHAKESDMKIVQKLQILRQTLFETIQNITRHTKEEYYDIPNQIMYEIYIKCMQEYQPKYHDNLQGFLNKLINTQFPKQVECFIRLNNYLKSDIQNEN